MERQCLAFLPSKSQRSDKIISMRNTKRLSRQATREGDLDSFQSRLMSSPSHDTAWHGGPSLSVHLNPGTPSRFGSTNHSQCLNKGTILCPLRGSHWAVADAQRRRLKSTPKIKCTMQHLLQKLSARSGRNPHSSSLLLGESDALARSHANSAQSLCHELCHDLRCFFCGRL